ncbi:MAG: hypothetical protein K2Q32_07810 [Alphaproteobacteria bacterium]|nr:hypothetical protein [Alphaproteobacteria bacterium]
MIFCGITRYTLLLSQRAAVLMLTNGKDIETSWILPYQSDSFYETLLGALKRHPFYPLKIIVDSAQLDVRSEALPPVSPWARKQIIERQRAHLFPKAQLETSSSYRDANGKWIVLHAATPEEAWLQPIFDRLQQIANPIEPLSFLATEWFDLAGQVSVMPQKGWAYINILGESFGLRQLVLRDGRVVFTRSHPDCVPSLSKDDLTLRIAEHIRSTLEYLPRLDSSIGPIAPRLYVTQALSDLAEVASLQVMKAQIITSASPKAAHVPPEWTADIAWLHVAAQEKDAAMPVDTTWLKQLRDGSMKRQIALWVLIFFGSAGIYSGMSILTNVDGGQVVRPAPVPSLAMEPIKPVSVVEPPLATPPVLKLNAVIYNSPQDWVVWINGEKHVPGDVKNNLTMVDVSPQSVLVHWQEGKAEQQMTLNLVPSSSQIVSP